jgi:serine/threonine protein kinase KIN1/2
MTPFPTGEINREVFEMISANSMLVRFEINIIKVGFWIYGCRMQNADVQDADRSHGCRFTGSRFDEREGNGWQYQMLASWRDGSCQ